MKRGAIACVVALACGSDHKSDETMTEEYGPRIAARLALLAKAGAAAKAFAGIELEQGTANPAMNFDDVSKAATVNGLVVQLDDLEDLRTDASPRLRAVGYLSDHVRRAKVFTGVKSADYSAGTWSMWEADLAIVARASYVLVVKPGWATMPNGGAGELEPGHVTSSNVLVEIATTKVIGSFEIAAESSTEVRLYHRKDQVVTAEAVDRKLVDDLHDQWSHAIAEGLAKRWPGTAVPYRW